MLTSCNSTMQDKTNKVPAVCTLEEGWISDHNCTSFRIIWHEQTEQKSRIPQKRLTCLQTLGILILKDSTITLHPVDQITVKDGTAIQNLRSSNTEPTQSMRLAGPSPYQAPHQSPQRNQITHATCLRLQGNVEINGYIAAHDRHTSQEKGSVKPLNLHASIHYANLNLQVL